MKTKLCATITFTLAVGLGRLPEAAAGGAAGRGARLGGVDWRRRCVARGW